MERNTVKSALTDSKLYELIHEKIATRVEGEVLNLTLPWQLGGSVVPVDIRIEETRLPSVDAGRVAQSLGCTVAETTGDELIISDGGRAMAELERRVGDVSPYCERIEKILYGVGMYSLRGGRIIEKSFILSSKWETKYRLYGLLTAMTIVANLDILPAFAESKWSSKRNI